MIAKQTVDEFLAQPALAIVGAGRNPRKFGVMALKGLVENGYKVFPVHPEAESVEGLPCHRSLGSLPEPVGGVVIVVPPKQAEAVVREAGAAGIRRAWLQQGSESPEVLRACEEAGVTPVHGECLLMFLPRGAGIHRFHRGIRRFFGRMPK